MDIIIDNITPCLIERKTGDIVPTRYSLVTPEELRGTKNRNWEFNWAQNNLSRAMIYKVTVSEGVEIQGLVAIEDDVRDKAVYIKIAESAPHNKGAAGQYIGVGGHLFAVAVKRSLDCGFGGFAYMDAKNRKNKMTKSQIEEMKALDEAAEEAGGYVAFPSSNDVHYDYREIINYCKKRNMKPIDMTIREVNRFIVNEA